MFMTAQRKKLIEVSLPLEDINRESAREKSIRHGHPSTLHLWWARRPLAACRAVLFAQFVDDPSVWPEEFPTEEDQARERARLHEVIGEMVPWEATNDERILRKARYEIARSLARGRGEAPPPAKRWGGDSVLSCGACSTGLRSVLRRRLDSRWKRNVWGCALTARTSIPSRCWFPRRPARFRRSLRAIARRSILSAIRM